MNAADQPADATPATKRPRGRKRLPADLRLVQRSIRLLPSDWAIIDANGMEWLRKVVRTTRMLPPPPAGPSKTAKERQARTQRSVARALRKLQAADKLSAASEEGLRPEIASADAVGA